MKGPRKLYFELPAIRARIKARQLRISEENEVLRALLWVLLSRPSDDSFDAVWVDESYNEAPPDAGGIWFLTPRQIAERKARAALEDIPGREVTG